MTHDPVSCPVKVSREPVSKYHVTEAWWRDTVKDIGGGSRDTNEL